MLAACLVAFCIGLIAGTVAGVFKWAWLAGASTLLGYVVTDLVTKEMVDVTTISDSERITIPMAYILATIVTLVVVMARTKQGASN